VQAWLFFVADTTDFGLLKVGLLLLMLTAGLWRKMSSVVLHHVVLSREARVATRMEAMKVLLTSVDSVMPGKMTTDE
jgi:hypothetical protein